MISSEPIDQDATSSLDRASSKHLTHAKDGTLGDANSPPGPNSSTDLVFEGWTSIQCNTERAKAQAEAHMLAATQDLAHVLISFDGSCKYNYESKRNNGSGAYVIGNTLFPFSKTYALPFGEDINDSYLTELATLEDALREVAFGIDNLEATRGTKVHFVSLVNDCQELVSDIGQYQRSLEEITMDPIPDAKERLLRAIMEWVKKIMSMGIFVHLYWAPNCCTGPLWFVLLQMSNDSSHCL